MSEDILADEVKKDDTFDDDFENDYQEYEGKNPFKKLKSKIKHGMGGRKLSKKTIIIGIICIIAAVAVGSGVVKKLRGGKESETTYASLTVQRMNIEKTVDGSSVIEANDTYDVTALVQGEILSDTFEEGDVVTKDQLLYSIDSEDAEKSVQTAKNALLKAQQSYSDAIRKKADTVKTNTYSEKAQQNAITKALNAYDSAVRSYNSAETDYNDLSVPADFGGIVAEVYVTKGQNINIVGTNIAKVYKTDTMKIQIPFNEADAAGIKSGDEAVLTLAGSGEKLKGVVESVSDAEVATNAHAVMKYVKIKVDNPGGLTVNDKASATVGDFACSDLGTFEYGDVAYISAKVSGTIKDVYVEKNDVVTAGESVALIESDTIENQYADAEDSVENAQLDIDEAYDNLEKLIIENDTYSLDSSIQTAKLSLDDARLELEKAEETLDDYKIKAPIDGTIITKNKKAGDKLEQNNSSSNEPMAVIYDMSTLKVQLTIDETEIHSIEVGQEVTITADAVQGTFTGTVTKVGVNGTSENGVTTYPVDIAIQDYGDLLPGMNVDCVIVVESAENVLAIPAEGLQRGNVVYVEGEKTEENDRAPEGYHSISVETGISNDTFVEIKAGLEEGDTICGSEMGSGIEAVGEQDMQSMMGGGMSGGMGGGMPGGGGGMPAGGGGMSGGGGMGGGPR